MWCRSEFVRSWCYVGRYRSDTVRSWFCAEPPHRSGCLTTLNTVIWDKLISWSPKVWNRQVFLRNTRKNILIWRISIKLISDVLRAVCRICCIFGQSESLLLDGPATVWMTHSVLKQLIVLLQLICKRYSCHLLTVTDNTLASCHEGSGFKCRSGVRCADGGFSRFFQLFLITTK
jgi:hypothetical protein